jgi:hypothetical protein
VAEKVELARAAAREFELPIVLSALELAKSTWYYHQRSRSGYEQKYAHLREPLDAIAREFPEYGYRRTQTELRESYGEARNHKVIRRLHGLWDLPLVRGTKAPKPSGVRRAIKTAGARANLLGDLETIAPLDVFYTDFSEIVYDGGRAKAHLIPILDLGSKVALGWSLGAQGNSELALEGVESRASDTRLLGPGSSRLHRSSRSGLGLHRLRVDGSAPAGGRLSHLVRAQRPG